MGQASKTWFVLCHTHDDTVDRAEEMNVIMTDHIQKAGPQKGETKAPVAMGQATQFRSELLPSFVPTILPIVPQLVDLSTCEPFQKEHNRTENIIIIIQSHTIK